MPTKIKIRRGQRLVLVAKKKRVRRRAQTETGTKRRKGFILSPDAESVYRPRRGGDTILEFYDLGRNEDGSTWNFEAQLTGGVQLELPPSEVVRFQTEVLARLADAENHYKIPYAKSWLYLLDALFYSSLTEKKLFAVAEPNRRKYLRDTDFNPPAANTETPEWTESGNGRAQFKLNYPKLRINSLQFFYQFDTGNATDFRVTTAPDFNAPVVNLSLAKAKSIKIYLVPKLFIELLFQRFLYSDAFETVIGEIYGRFIMTAFPREFLANHELFNPLTVSPDVDIVNYGAAGVETAANPQQAAMRSVVSPIVNGRTTTNLVIQRGGGNVTGFPFAQWDAPPALPAPFIRGANFAKGLGYQNANYALAGFLVGIINKNGTNYYIWANDLSPTQRNILSAMIPDTFLGGISIGSNSRFIAGDSAANDDWRLL